jgi:predicted aldo/keto reductase-like oxidoreductase
MGTFGHLSLAGDDSTGTGAQPAPRVPRRTLGSTGESIPILLMGCAQKFDAKYDKLLHRAFREGVDYLDTAIVYEGGQSHKTIAPFLGQIGDRKKVWITSKGPGSASKNLVEAYEKELDVCLEQLQTDYLDLYFMHGIDDVDVLEPEFIKMGERLRKSGKTRFFGFSCHGRNEVALLNKAAKVGGIDVIMFRYHFGRYGELELNRAIDALKKAGVGLIAMKTQDSVPAEQEEVVAFRSKDFTLGQAKLKAVWADERIDSVVSHMDNTKWLQENIAAAKSPVKLSMDDFQQLQRLATARAAYACQGCSHICEAHVAAQTRVADLLRFLMYHEAYGEAEKARRLFRELPAEARTIDGVDFRAATAACPRGIDIASRLARAHDVLSA